MNAQIKPITAARVAKLVDEAGSLKAQIAALEDQLASRMAVLRDKGPGEYLGKAYKVTVAESKRVTLDNAMVKVLLTPAQIAECSRTSVSVSATVRAR